MPGGEVLDLFPFLYGVSVPLVVDLYDPLLLETFEIWSSLSVGERLRLHNLYLSRNNRHIKTGDFFICASEKQRDFWIGMLVALGRVNSYTYYRDRELRKLIDVVGFGLPEEKPIHTRDVLRGVCRNIKEGDKILLWNGGIWNWLDPITLIKAMKAIVQKRDDVKLLFMGSKHPSQKVPQMEVCSQAIQLAKDLELYDRYVFFNDWVPYEERSNFLLEADFGVCLHKEHLETKFSFRTRVLDCIWSGLPIIISKGDSMSELVEEKELGVVVPPGDELALKKALLTILDEKKVQDKFKSNLSEIAPQFSWGRVLQPLQDFCDSPYRAPDKEHAQEFRLLSVKYYLSRIRFYYEQGGLPAVLKRLLKVVKRDYQGE